VYCIPIDVVLYPLAGNTWFTTPVSIGETQIECKMDNNWQKKKL
jgi:hypothetical protein